MAGRIVAAAGAARHPDLWPPAPGLPALTPGDRVHLVGIGGAGMSGLARALLELGLRVSGSDRQASPATTELAAAGVAITIGHSADHLPDGCDLVVVSPAVPDDNPELRAAVGRGTPVTKRAVLLGALIDSRTGIAVAGTHGKTTTSGMLAHILTTAGLDPSYFVGGDIIDLGANAHLGSGPHVVVEADEYDRSFLNGHPAVAVVTNVEHDHPDIYATFDDVREAFAAFAARIRPGGRLIVDAGSPAAAALVPPAGVTRETYAVAEAAPAPAPDWRAHGVAATPDGQMFDVDAGGACLGTWSLRLSGLHNVANALAAIAAATALGVDPAVVRRALADYRGARRRFQVLGRAGGVTLVDDYAHHPTEIAATLAAARQRFPGQRVIAVVEPHTYSRVALLADAFADALRDADRVVVAPIYAAREAPLPGVDAARIAAGIPGADAATDLDAAAARAAALAAPGDVVLFLGAGDIPRASRACFGRLRADDARRLVDAAAARGLGGDVALGAALADVTSLRVGGAADVLVRARSIDDLAGWWRLAHALAIPVRVIGRGTNVLAGDGGCQGLVIVNRCERWSVEPRGTGEAGPADAAEVRCESGVTLAALAQSLARAGWAGIEAGVGIPGSVGAGVVTNAGAHGWEMADSVVAVEVIARDGSLQRLAPAALGFRYRGSRLKGDTEHAVLGVTLRVVRDAPAAILDRIAAYTARRRATQPTAPSVGSMFKNPPGDHAGRLIEAAGLKGVAVGGAEVSPVHANFFVNRGGARAADVLALMRLAQERVRARFGIALEPEIERLGVDDVV